MTMEIGGLSPAEISDDFSSLTLRNYNSYQGPPHPVAFPPPPLMSPSFPSSSHPTSTDYFNRVNETSLLQLANSYKSSDENFSSDNDPDQQHPKLNEKERNPKIQQQKIQFKISRHKTSKDENIFHDDSSNECDNDLFTGSISKDKPIKSDSCRKSAKKTKEPKILLFTSESSDSTDESLEKLTTKNKDNSSNDVENGEVSDHSERHSSYKDAKKQKSKYSYSEKSEYSDIGRNIHGKYYFKDNYSKKKDYHSNPKDDYSDKSKKHKDRSNYRDRKSKTHRSHEKRDKRDKTRYGHSSYEHESRKNKDSYGIEHRFSNDWDYMDHELYDYFLLEKERNQRVGKEMTPSDEHAKDRRKKKKSRASSLEDPYKLSSKGAQRDQDDNLLNTDSSLKNFKSDTSLKDPFKDGESFHDGELEPGEYISENESEEGSGNSKVSDACMDSEMRYTPEPDFCDYDELLLKEKQRLQERFYVKNYDGAGKESPMFTLDRGNDSLPIRDEFGPQFNTGFANTSAHFSRESVPFPLTNDKLKPLSNPEPRKAVPLIKRLGLLDEPEEKGSLQIKSSTSDKSEVTSDPEIKSNKNAQNQIDPPNKQVEKPINTIIFSQDTSTGVDSFKGRMALFPPKDSNSISSPNNKKYASKPVKDSSNESVSTSKSPNKGTKQSRHAKTAEKNKKDKLIMLEYLSKTASTPQLKTPIKKVLKSPAASKGQSHPILEESPVRPNLDSRIQVLFGEEEKVSPPKLKPMSPFATEYRPQAVLPRPPSPFKTRASYLFWFKETIKFRKSNLPLKYPFFDPSMKFKPSNARLSRKLDMDINEKLGIHRLDASSVGINKPISASAPKPVPPPLIRPLLPPPLPPPSLLPPSLVNIHDKIREVSEKIVPKAAKFVELQKSRHELLATMKPNTEIELSNHHPTASMHPPLPNEHRPSPNVTKPRSRLKLQKQSEKEVLRHVLFKLIGDLKVSLKRSLTDSLVDDLSLNDNSVKRTKLS